jgi:hypothetical protein
VPYVCVCVWSVWVCVVGVCVCACECGRSRGVGGGPFRASVGLSGTVGVLRMCTGPSLRCTLRPARPRSLRGHASRCVDMTVPFSVRSMQMLQTDAVVMVKDVNIYRQMLGRAGHSLSYRPPTGPMQEPAWGYWPHASPFPCARPPPSHISGGSRSRASPAGQSGQSGEGGERRDANTAAMQKR